MKVSSASQEKQRRHKTKSMFYVDPNDLKTDDNIFAHIEFPFDDDEQCIYGDNWSSDDDFDADNDNDNGVNDHCDDNYHSSIKGSFKLFLSILLSTFIFHLIEQKEIL